MADKHPAAMERAGYWFKEIVLPDPAPPSSAAAPSNAEPERTEADIDAEAELYVVMYPTGPSASAPRAACRPASTSAHRGRRSSPGS